MTDGPHESEVDEWRRLARRDWQELVLELFPEETVDGGDSSVG